MDTMLMAVGVILLLIGLIRHYLPGWLPQTRFRLVKLSGMVTAGVGVLLVVVGIIL